MASTSGRRVVVPLTNKSGGAVAAGDVVIIDTSNDDAFTTTTSAAFTGTVGVAQAAIANNAVGPVCLAGEVALVNVSASVTRGHYGATHTVAKQAASAGASRVVGSFVQFKTGGTTPKGFVYPVDLGAGSGAVATDVIFDTKGDIPIGTGANTSAKFPAGANGTVPTADSSQTTGYKANLPPGYEFDYAQITSTSSPTATSEATATAIITGNAVTYDGSTIVIIECFLPTWEAPTNVAGANINLWLYDGSSSIGQMAFKRVAATGNNEESLFCARRLMPSNASHTYSVRVSISAIGAEAGQTVGGGAGGSGNTMPAYLRIIKAG